MNTRSKSNFGLNRSESSNDSEEEVGQDVNVPEGGELILQVQEGIQLTGETQDRGDKVEIQGETSTISLDMLFIQQMFEKLEKNKEEDIKKSEKIREEDIKKSEKIREEDIKRSDKIREEDKKELIGKFDKASEENKKNLVDLKEELSGKLIRTSEELIGKLDKASKDTREENKRNLEELKESLLRNTEEKITKLTTEMDNREAKMRKEMEDKLKIKDTEVKTIITNKVQEVEGKVKVIQENVKQIEKNSSEKYKELAKRIREEVDQVNKEVSDKTEKLEENFCKRIENTEDRCLKEIKLSTDTTIAQKLSMEDILKECEEQKTKIQDLLLKTQNIKIPHVTCPPAYNVLNTGIRIENITHFSGDKLSTHPMAYLTNILRYIEEIQDFRSQMNIIRATLNSGAADWFQRVEDNCDDLSKFVELFKNNFWSETQQSRAHQRLLTGRYQPGKSSREAYAQRMFNYCRYISHLDEKTISQHLLQHFIPVDTHAIICQNVTDMNGLINILRRLDDYSDGVKYRESRQFNGRNDIQNNQQRLSNNSGVNNQYVRNNTSFQQNAYPRNYQPGNSYNNNFGARQPYQFNSQQNNNYNRNYNTQGNGNTNWNNNRVIPNGGNGRPSVNRNNPFINQSARQVPHNNDYQEQNNRYYGNNNSRQVNNIQTQDWRKTDRRFTGNQVPNQDRDEIGVGLEEKKTPILEMKLDPYQNAIPGTSH